jgi:hypothetical protein
VDVGNGITLAGVVVSAVSATVALVQAKRAGAAQRAAAGSEAKAETERRLARSAAEEAAVAQREAAAAAKRTADAIEEQNRRADEEAELAEGVPWRITFRTGSLYDLWNDSDRPKFGVHISGEGVLRDKTVARIDGRSSTDFMGLDAMGVGSRVDVTWHLREDRSDEPRRWSGNKPPRR